MEERETSGQGTAETLSGQGNKDGAVGPTARKEKKTKKTERRLRGFAWHRSNRCLKAREGAHTIRKLITTKATSYSRQGKEQLSTRCKTVIDGLGRECAINMIKRQT